MGDSQHPPTYLGANRPAGRLPEVKFRILGPVEVCRDTRPIPVAGAQQRALLALMLLNVGQVVPYWDLVDELWPLRGDRVRRNTVHAQITRLRHTISQHFRDVAIYSRSSGYMIEADPNEIDSVVFHQLRRQAGALVEKDPYKAVSLFQQALALWRGTALQDACTGARCRAAAARLDEARVLVQEQMTELYLIHGDPRSIVDDLRELVSLYPLRETLIEQLMKALHLSGRRVEAVTTYLESRRHFQEELGADPSPALQQTYLQILKD